MSRPERAYLAAMGALIGFALGYALPAFAHLPNLYYDPLARHWLVATLPGPLPMGYLGQVLYGAAGAVVGTLASLGLSSLSRKPVEESSLQVAAGWALTALLLVGAFFAWNNWP